MAFIPLQRRREDSSNQGQGTRQQDEGDTGDAKKLLRTKKEGRELGVPSTESERKTAPLPLNRSEEGKGGVDKKSVTALR